MKSFMLIQQTYALYFARGLCTYISCIFMYSYTYVPPLVTFGEFIELIPPEIFNVLNNFVSTDARLLAFYTFWRMYHLLLHNQQQKQQKIDWLF